jgi:hypothetical protein
MTPGDDVEGVQQEENADENDPDGAAEGAEEPELIAGRTVVSQSTACVGHPANEDPYAEADEEKWNEAVDGKCVEEAGVTDEEEAAESDEPDGASRETVSRRNYEIGVDDWIAWGSIGRYRGDGLSVAVPWGAPTCG